MNTIFYNGVIKTLDNAYPEVSAIWVKNGIVLRAGSDEEILALAGEDTKKVDLGGKLALPGFCDTHMHLMHFGVFSLRIDMGQATCYDDVVELIKADVPKAKEDGRWVLGWGWNQTYWTGTQKMPDRYDLDAISTEVPIYMQRACGHISCLNTKALQVCGLWDEDPATTKETIDFGPDGKPNGYVRENSSNVAMNVFQKYNKEEIKNMLETACQKALAKGIVQCHTDDFNIIQENDLKLNLEAFKELVEEDRLPIRVYEQTRFQTIDQMKDFLALGYKMKDKIGRFKFGPVKLLNDGSIGSHSAALREEYKNDPGVKGLSLFSDEDLYEIYSLAQKNGFDVVTHCIGDASLEQVLRTVERVIYEDPRPDWRHGVIHCQIMDAEQQERFKKLNIVAHVQPIFVKSDSNVVDDCVGPELAKQSYNWRRYIDLGVHQCGGSDCPVEPFDPLPNIYSAVTRKGSNGQPWYPENGVTVDEAVRMFTTEAAYASYEEQERGTLGVGKYCDMVVLDKNIYEIDPDEIKDTNVIMTVIDGEIVFEA